MILSAEQSALACALIDATCVPIVCGELEEADFISTATIEVFRVIKTLYESSIAIDEVTVTTELERVGKLDRIGGALFIAELSTLVPTSANVRHYIASMQNARKVRLFSSGVRRLADLAESGEDSFLEKARALIDQAASIGTTGITKGGSCLPEVTNRLGDTTSGVRTGFRTIDGLTRGLYPGRLYIIAARPGLGKTALACNMAANISRDGRTVAYFSLEMSAVEVMERINLSEAMVDRYSAYRGDAEATIKIFSVQSNIDRWELYIDDRSSLSAGELISGCYKVKQVAGRLDAVFVDYLQLLRITQRKNGNRAEDLGIVTRALKILSREVQCPVVLLAQLNRNAAGRRPVISDLRESGAIEQDADVIFLLHRDEPTEDCSEECRQQDAETLLIIGKNRHGRTGNHTLMWKPAYTRFMDEAFTEVQVPKGTFND